MNLREETIETCTEALMDYWERSLTDLQDVIELLHTQGSELTQTIAQKLHIHITQVVEKEHLCPYCFLQLDPICVKEQVGYYGSAPYYQPVVIALVCSRCDYREDV